MSTAASIEIRVIWWTQSALRGGEKQPLGMVQAFSTPSSCAHVEAGSKPTLLITLEVSC